MKSRTALILYNQISENPGLDEADVLAQVESVSESLASLGYEVLLEGVGLNLEKTAEILERTDPLFVFNLVESLNKRDHLISVVPLLLDTMGIPYTGNRSQSLQLTSGKVVSKKMFRHYGIVTPGWLMTEDILRGNIRLDPPYIIKSMWEHASAGIDDDSVAYSRESLKGIVEDKFSSGGSRHYFAEQYIDGRELNVSLLGGGDGPLVLPCAEIKFFDFAEGTPKIVGYRAKWIEDSREFRNTRRTFDFPGSDSGLLDAVREISLSCWKNFDLRGYARVDFRVGAGPVPYVLEINANPCISPDSGFMAAASRAGLGRDEVIKRIIDDTLKEFSI